MLRILLIKSETFLYFVGANGTEPIEMKNTLKIALILIGGAFFGIAIVYLLFKSSTFETRQLFGMAGVGFLFIIAGTAMGKR